MKKLKIGVSACFFYPDVQRTVFGHKTLAYLEQDMARYLARAGVIPILIPDLEDQRLQEYIEEIDGLVLQGGSDMSPASYGEQHLDEQRWPGDDHRDQYELDLVERCCQKQIPILGICRGAQVLNIYFGGTLYQDLETQKHNAIKHRDAAVYDHHHHEIKILAGGLLETIYPHGSPAVVNSVHHQGIKDLGDGLKIEALSEADQIIEAFSITDRQQFVIGVQWHPEFSHTLGDTVLPAEPLYDAFLDRAR